jgi:hypothetical protein
MKHGRKKSKRAPHADVQASGGPQRGREGRPQSCLKPGHQHKAAAVQSIDRVIRWCVVAFALSTAVLSAIAWHAIKTDRVAAYLNAAGIVYVLLSTGFLAVIAIAFVQGHLGSSREIEAPKLELFEIEERR